MRLGVMLLTVLLASAVSLNSCGERETAQDVVMHEAGVYQCPMKCEGDKTYDAFSRCPVCKMDLELMEPNDAPIMADEDAVPSESIFNLTSRWNTGEGESIELPDLKGDVLVMVMIYTSCKAACPRLVADMRSLHNKVGDPTVRYVLVSIDPETDTPERLKQFAIDNEMDSEQWTFLQGTQDDVRELANVLAVKYKRISPIDLSHSNIISVFDRSGVLIHQQEGLGVDNEETVIQINEALDG